MRRCFILLAVLALFALPQAPARANYAYGHDNSTNPAHDYYWTHGSPNTGNAPGNGQSSNGYYYLKAYAAGPVVFCEVYTGGIWLIQLEDADKNVLSQLQTNGTGGRVFVTNAATGHLYQCRIADDGTQAQDDYAELNSGALGDTHTSDCGGPGPVIDPATGQAPMEPPPTPDMPINGCDTPSTVKYIAGDPRSLPPTHEQHALGLIASNHTYTVSTTLAGTLVAFAFYGHQGSKATLTITDTAGNIRNGPKWGDAVPNPKTMSQEFVEASAGVQPAGTYQVHYSGPNNAQQVWALVTPPLSAAAPVARANAILSPWRVQGNQIVDAAGGRVQMQGATLSGLEYRCALGGRYTIADFAAMRAWRMNVAKIPVNPHYYSSLGDQSCDGTRASQWAYRRAVQTAVANAEGAGLHVIITILDYSTAVHGGQPAPDRYTVWTETDLGHRYAADGAVLLETFSEPHGISNGAWLTGVQTQIAAINRAAPQMIILIDGPQWSGVPGLAYSAGYRPHGANLAYAAHIYDQGHNANPANWPRDFASLAQTYPVIATEFGDVTHHCDAAWIDHLMPYMAAHVSGWLAWAWDAGTSCQRPDLLRDWTGTPSVYGQPIQAFYAPQTLVSPAASLRCA